MSFIPTQLISVPIFTLVLAFFKAASAIGPVSELRIVNNDISPDGFKRSAVLAGGTLPGPLISGMKGDIFSINVFNELTDPTMLTSTSIHWHGIHQVGTNWADGTSFVTQCPIITNHSFLYEFPVQNQAGTYWYHSHLSTQYCDGLRGPMIVYDPEDPHEQLYDIDDESTVITLADWYHVPSRSAGSTPSAATLINGRGRYDAGPDVDLAVIPITQGKRYRFRIIAMSCDSTFTFSIDGHTMTIIEADGENTVPHEVDSFDIHAGQRYSVVVQADQAIDNYWIRAHPTHGMPGFKGGRNSAILHYTGANEVEPLYEPIPPPSKKPLREVDLYALVDAAAPGRPSSGGADIRLNLVTGFADGKFTMNGHPFVPPNMPALLQIISGASSAQELLPQGSYYELPRGKVIEVSLPGTGPQAGGRHPFHLHGHSFSVVRSAGSDTYNFENPVRRDTVDAGLEGSNTTIRFMTDNAGPWFLHCHVDRHLDLGLAVVFTEDIPNVVKENQVPSTSLILH